MAAKRANAPFLLRILERGFQNLVNDSVDLLFGGIEFDAAPTTVHDDPLLIAVREGSGKLTARNIS